MTRSLRIEYPGAVYHLTSRGNRREEVFLSDADRTLFLETLAHAMNRFDWICHAYCLMDNHYHLLIETPEPNLSRGMRHLNGVYTQRFNRRHARVGHLFQGRYKAILVQKDAHLLELCRYVVLNPVRAGIRRSAEAWPWSSYRATVGRVERPGWLTTDWVLRQFGRRRGAAVRAYRRFVVEGVGRKVWDGRVGGIYFGDEDFIQRVPKDEEIREVPRAQRRPVRPGLRVLLSQGSPAEVGRAYLEHGYRLGEIAAHLRVHYSTVSRRLREHERK